MFRKTAIALIALFIAAAGVSVPAGATGADPATVPLVMKYELTAFTSKTVDLYVTRSGSFQPVIDWGHASATTVVNHVSGVAKYSYTYPANGVYEVRITGTFLRLHNDSDPNAQQIIEVVQFGDGVQSLKGMFANAVNLEKVPPQLPERFTDLSFTFYNAMVPLQVRNWDVSRVTLMQFMFHNAGLFFDLAPWRLDSITDMANFAYKYQKGHYSASLRGWAAYFQTLSTASLDVVRNTTIRAANYTAGYGHCDDTATVAARSYLVTTLAWTVTDGGPQPCVTPAAPLSVAFNSMSATSLKVTGSPALVFPETYTITAFDGATPVGSCIALSYGADKDSCVIDGLTDSTSYSFSITKSSDGGTSVALSPAPVHVFQALPAAPGATGQPIAMANPGSITVTWPAPTSGGAPTAYTVTATPFLSCTVSFSDREATCATPAAGINYTFTVIATNAGGSSGASPASDAVTSLAISAPGSISELVATAGVGQVSLAWSAPTSGGAVARYSVSSTPSGCLLTNVSAAATSVVCPGLVNGTAYTFSVVAINSGGSSTAVTSASVTPAAAAPGDNSVPGDDSSSGGSMPSSFSGPVISNGGSSQPALPGGEVILGGSQLGGVTEATIGGKAAEVLSNTDTSLRLLVPADLTPGTYDLELTTSSGKITIQGAITITTATAETTADGSKGQWTKAVVSESGAVKEVKMYAKDPINAGKIQFRQNGKEIAWIRAVDETDPKLRTVTSGPMAGTNYLVRTVTLLPGKNALEIFIDGVRVWRAAYTLR